MKTIRSIFVAACFGVLPGVLFAQQPDSGKSPGGHVSYEIRSAGDGKEIWVWRDDEKARANKMCGTLGTRLRLSFSPDDRWIIVEDGSSSMGVSLRLFHRKGEYTYEENDKENIDGKAEIAALQQVGGPPKEVANHRYAECLDWSADSNLILVRVSGKGEERYNKVEFHWLGVYDLESGKFGADLGRMNKDGVKESPR